MASTKTVENKNFAGLQNAISAERQQSAGGKIDQETINQVEAWRQLALSEIAQSFGVDQVSMRAMTVIVRRQPSYQYVTNSWKNQAEPGLLDRAITQVGAEIKQGNFNTFGVGKKSSVFEMPATKKAREARLADFVGRSCWLAVVEDELVKTKKTGLVPNPDAVQDIVNSLSQKRGTPASETATLVLDTPVPTANDFMPSDTPLLPLRPESRSPQPQRMVESSTETSQPWQRVAERLQPLLSIPTTEEECSPVVAAMMLVLARGVRDPQQMLELRAQCIAEYQQTKDRDPISFAGDKIYPLFDEGLARRTDQIAGMYSVAEQAEESAWSGQLMSLVANSNSQFADAAKVYRGPRKFEMQTPVKIIVNPGFRSAEVVANLNPAVSSLKPGESVYLGKNDEHFTQNRLSLLVAYDGTNRFILDPVAAVIAKASDTVIEAEDYITLRGVIDAR